MDSVLFHHEKLLVDKPTSLVARMLIRCDGERWINGSIQRPFIFIRLGPLLNDVQHDRSIIGQRTRTAGDYREDVHLYVRERPATGQQVKKWLLNEIGWD
jgi:hypothetical protein